MIELRPPARRTYRRPLVYVLCAGKYENLNADQAKILSSIMKRIVKEGFDIANVFRGTDDNLLERFANIKGCQGVIVIAFRHWVARKSARVQIGRSKPYLQAS